MSNEMEEMDDFFRPKRLRGRDNGGASDLTKFPPTAVDDMMRPRPETARDWANDEMLCKRLRLYRFGTGVNELMADVAYTLLENALEEDMQPYGSSISNWCDTVQYLAVNSCCDQLLNLQGW